MKEFINDVAIKQSFQLNYIRKLNNINTLYDDSLTNELIMMERNKYRIINEYFFERPFLTWQN